MGNYDHQSLDGAIVGGTHIWFKEDQYFFLLSWPDEDDQCKGQRCIVGTRDSVSFRLGGIVYEATVRLVDFYYLEQKSTNVDPMMLDFTKW